MKEKHKNMGKVVSLIHSTERSLIPIIMTISLLSAISPFINYAGITFILNELLGEKRIAYFVRYVMFIIAAQAVTLLLKGLLEKAKRVKLERVRLAFETILCNRISQLSYETMISNRYNELKRATDQSSMWGTGIGKITEGISNISDSIITLIVAGISIIVTLGVVYHEDQIQTFFGRIWTILVILFVLTLLTKFNLKMHKKTNRKITDLFMQIQKSNAGAMTFVNEVSDYHEGKEIRIYGLTDTVSNIINHMREDKEGLVLYKKMSSLKAKNPSMASLLSACLFLVSYMDAGLRAMRGEIAAGSISILGGSIHEFGKALFSFSSIWSEFQEDCELFQPYIMMLELPVQEVREEKACMDYSAEKIVQLRSVSYKYENQERYALNNINMSIDKGSKIAIVGENGSGKTTLAEVICGLLCPDTGEVFVDGVRVLDESCTRDKISVIFQDYKIFATSLEENLTCELEPNEKRLQTAIHDAGLSDFAAKHSMRSDLFKEFSDEGIEVSGGEAQKIAIARAFYQNHEFMILDEPTAALDPLSEYEMYNRINQLSENKTILFITHRLSSCRFCDRIIVLQNGAIVQDGSHEELMRDQHSPYYILWNAQAEFYKKERQIDYSEL